MKADLVEGLPRPCRLMTVFPHPDDESFAAGGVLALYSQQEGVRTAALALTSGGKSEALLKVGLDPGREPLIRMHEFRAAATLLGVEEALIWDYPDAGLAEIPESELRSRIVQALRDLRADVVITYGPEGITGHPDHIVCSRVVERAAGEAGVKRLFQVSAPGWVARLFLGVPVPPATHAVDIRSVYAVKMLALKEHASQMLISREPMIWVGIIMRFFGKEYFHQVF